MAGVAGWPSWTIWSAETSTIQVLAEAGLGMKTFSTVFLVSFAPPEVLVLEVASPLLPW